MSANDDSFPGKPSRGCPDRQSFLKLPDGRTEVTPGGQEKEE